MYTHNPVSGKNETLVNVSMLEGLAGGVSRQLSTKANQSDLTAVNETAVEALSAAQTAQTELDNRVKNSVYEKMVKGYVKLACKVADADILEEAAEVAYSFDAVTYAASDPDDANVADLTTLNYKVGNPVYTAVNGEIAAGKDTVELAPLMRLRTFIGGYQKCIINWSDREQLIHWKTQLPSIVRAVRMFAHCSSLTDWVVELPNLTDGQYAFQETGIQEWSVELPSLTNGTEMFYGCQALSSFTGLLFNLQTAQSMFANTSLTAWSLETPNLTVGQSMFYHSSLERFDGQLCSLTNGETMFAVAADATKRLTHFNAPLSSLQNGTRMFENARLDIDSLVVIAETLCDHSGDTSQQHKIDIGVDTSVVGTETYNTCCQTIIAKGWTLTINGNAV